jgi:uncharacterized protein (TIGR03067 family)
MRPVLTLALLLAAPAVRADDPEPPAPKDVDLKALQGTWQVTSAKGAASDDHTLLTVTFAKDKLTVKIPGITAKESTFTLDPRKKPRQIDITYDGRTTRGIYKIEKGELHLCMNKGGETARPKTFTEKGALQLILKKAKK